MNRLLIIISVISPLSTITWAEEISLDNISLSGAPAMALSSSAPTEIARPTGARQLGLSLLGGTAGENFAFETKPYWWSDHIIGNDFFESSAGWDTIRQTFSLSGARYEIKNAEGEEVAEISLGLAFDFVRGRATGKFFEAREKFGKASTMPDTLPGVDPGVILDSMKITAEQQKYADQMFDEMVKGRVGWNVSFAAATSYQYQDKDYNGGEIAKTGAWLISSYTPDTGGDQFSYMGLVRFLDDQGPATDDTYLDIGARILWTLDETPLSISGEYIRRFSDKSEDSERLTALVEYQVNKQVSIFASHGLAFDQGSDKDEVFSAFGMSFGIGKGPKEKPAQ